MQTMPLQIVPSPTPSSVRQVSPDEIIAEWPRVEPLLERALGEGSYTSADVARGCLMGGWVLWLSEREEDVVGICITEIIDFPRQRKCLMRYMAGDSEMFGHLPRLEAYAAAHGCDLIEAYTRKGMARLAPDWTQRYIILQKTL